ncbi:MAG: hypothetical protein GVY20_17805 [Bacteroidetes bacterium]|jgi:hypothetical protein|nr:hypothetical protein [Bacteroidota bacterium]
MTNEIELSDFQNKVLSIPQEYDLFLGGGRGGAKSFTLALIALRYAEQYKERARILYIRQTYRGLADFEQITMDLFGQLYGKKASYNATEHVWRLPNGSYFELGQLESPRDYTKYQGRSFGLLLQDEITQYPTPTMLDKLRSNLRAPKDIPIRVVAAANPGGAGHQWVAQRYVFKNAGTWKPFDEEKSEKQWVYAPSTFLDNPFIDQQQYKKQLAASCPSDPELLRAWLDGDWTVARGAFFGSVLEENRNAIDPWKEIPKAPEGFGKYPGIDNRNMWEHWLAHDYGSSAPSVTYVMVKSPGGEVNGRYYPKDSIIIVDELATNELDDLSSGMGYTVPVLSERIKELAEKWDIKPEGCADDAIFAQHGSGAGSIADEFKQQGVYFRRAKKADRKTGWEKMRTMLQNAGEPDQPGLYISRSCEYFWNTVPYLGRDPRNAEDLDTRAADHAADAVRYGLLYDGGYKMITGMINW